MGIGVAAAAIGSFISTNAAAIGAVAGVASLGTAGIGMHQQKTAARKGRRQADIARSDAKGAAVNQSRRERNRMYASRQNKANVSGIMSQNAAGGGGIGSTNFQGGGGSTSLGA